MGKRVFSDERINEILGSFNWNRLFRNVYEYAHSERIEEDYSLEFFMYDRHLTIELWAWDYDCLEWRTVGNSYITTIDNLSDKLEKGIRICLELATI